MNLSEPMQYGIIGLIGVVFVRESFALFKTLVPKLNGVERFDRLDGTMNLILVELKGLRDDMRLMRKVIHD